ncbi:hypothetical protein [Actinomadura rudentiformis]|uniref:Uncharacterized protein n=1 Tax=Actinomadura rudentiformis TaxID=359158 RepID=A0A6H9Z1D3_9ACTN|nr:hypothetical protein [Actinomadura rudentiformis]KAB2351605.1 hypothetical protein F8566_05110 [Actinomadura rudentiformis]
MTIKTDASGRPYAVVFCPLCHAVTTASGSGVEGDPVMFPAHVSFTDPAVMCLNEPTTAREVLTRACQLHTDTAKRQSRDADAGKQ